MQKFYLVRKESDPDIVGIKDGSAQCEFIRARFTDKNNYDIFYRNLGTKEYWSFVASTRQLPAEIERADLRKNAKLTDFLSFCPHFINCPFLISDKAHQILLKCRLGSHQFYKTKVFIKNESKIYWLYHLLRFGDDIYDLRKSKFCIDGDLRGPQTYEFQSLEEMTLFEKTSYGLRPDTVFLAKSFDRSLDLFVLGSSHIIISERLKVALEKQSISGIKVLSSYDKSAPWVKVYD